MFLLQDIPNKEVPMNASHIAVQRLIARAVIPLHATKGSIMTLEEINNQLITTLDLILRRISRNESAFYNVAQVLDDEYYDSFLPSIYNEITYMIMESVSSIYMDHILFYYNRKHVFEYIRLMIVEEYALSHFQEYRKKKSMKTTLEHEAETKSKAIDTITDIIYHTTISYDVEKLLESFRQFKQIILKDMPDLIRETIAASQYIVPDIVIELLETMKDESNIIQRFTEFYREAAVTHTLTGFQNMYRKYCKTYRDDQEKLVITRANCIDYHAIGKYHLIDGLTIDEIKILERILTESTTIADQEKIQQSTILTNIHHIIKHHKKIQDTITFEENKLILTSINKRVREYNFRDTNLIDKLIDPFRMFGTQAERYKQNKFYDSDDSILTQTGVTMQEMSRIQNRQIANPFIHGPQAKVLHRQRMIARLKKKYRSDPNLMAKIEEIDRDRLLYFTYNNLQQINKQLNSYDEKRLLLQLVEIEKAYQQLHNDLQEGRDKL